MIDLIDVITDHPGHEEAYGVTFTDPATASAYADRMQASGYGVVILKYDTALTLDDALTAARNYFGDPRLTVATTPPAPRN